MERRYQPTQQEVTEQKPKVDRAGIILGQFLGNALILDRLLRPQGDFAIQKKAKRLIENLNKDESTKFSERLITRVLIADQDSDIQSGELLLLSYVEFKKVDSQTRKKIKNASDKLDETIQKDKRWQQILHKLEREEKLEEAIELEGEIEIEEEMKPESPTEQSHKQIISDEVRERLRRGEQRRKKEGFPTTLQQKVIDLWPEGHSREKMAEIISAELDEEVTLGMVRSATQQVRNHGIKLETRVYGGGTKSEVDKRRSAVAVLDSQGFSPLEIYNLFNGKYSRAVIRKDLQYNREQAA